MKFTMGRTMKIVVAVLIVAVIAIVMLSPYSFEKYTASSKMIQVTSTDTVTKDANGKKKQQVYSYKKDDKNYHLFIFYFIIFLWKNIIQQDNLRKWQVSH